jgi:DNA-binding MarR family transcriptional regulator
VPRPRARSVPTPRESRRPTPTTELELEDFQRAAAFRAALRAFLQRGERVARRAGLTPQRQLLLLMIKGAPDGSETASVTDLAERLCLAQSTVTELVARAEERGLVRRESAPHDGRVVLLRLTDEGERLLAPTVSALMGDREQLVEVLARHRPPPRE